MQKIEPMNDTVLYTIVFIAAAHFIVAVVFLIRKLSGPVPDESTERLLQKSDEPSILNSIKVFGFH